MGRDAGYGEGGGASALLRSESARQGWIAKAPLAKRPYGTPPPGATFGSAGFQQIHP